MSGKTKEWSGEFRKKLELLPADFSKAKGIAEEMSHAFHAELAAALGPRLNSHVKKLPQATFAERRDLASWCNHELHSLRLAVRCPKTNLPGILIADSRDRESDYSRFRIAVHDTDGRQKKTFSSDQLPEFVLMEEPIRREPLSKWRPTDRTDPKGRA